MLISIEQLKKLSGYELCKKEITSNKKNILKLKPWCTSIAEVVFCLKNDINNPQKCDCESKLKFKELKTGYSEFCSSKCAHNSPKTKFKYKETMNFKSHDDLKKIQEKRNKTNLEKYGNICSLHGEQTKEKTNKTWKLKFGGHPWSNCEIRTEISKILMKKYGVDNYFKLSSEIQKAMFKKFGFYNPMLVPEIKNKSVKHSKQTKLKQRISFLKNNFPHLITNPLNPLNDSNQYFCKDCNTEFTGTFNISRKFNCPVCYPFSKSQGEEEVFDFINSLNIEIMKNSRKIIKPLELDLYLPDQNIAIEYNGIYWHSELRGKNKKYHLNKTKLCEEQGIQLLHIFENEWNNKKEIVKSIIKSKLGLNDKIFARKCTIKEINPKIKNTFLNENHIQGEDKSKVKLGLFYKDELVSIMTFCKSRFNKNIDWELSRFCNKSNTSIIGGASKLLKYFERTYNPISLITYADRRYSQGELYLQLGFDFKHNSQPNYFYFKSDKLHSRQQFQKHKLKDKLKLFDEKLSEWENMVNNGYNRIWDSGNKVFIKEYNEK